MSLFQATLRFKDIKQFRFVCVNSKFEAFESRWLCETNAFDFSQRFQFCSILNYAQIILKNLDLVLKINIIRRNTGKALLDL